MAMVGAFLGGTKSIIPAGYGVVNVTWVPTDGQNLSNARVVLSGSNGTFEKTTESDGKTQFTVPSGSYTAEIYPEGDYLGISSKQIEVASKIEYDLLWVGIANPSYQVRFTSPQSFDTGVSFTLRKGEDVVESGNVWGQSQTFELKSGTYVLSLSIYGDIIEYEFSAISDTEINLNDRFTRIVYSLSVQTPITSTYNGYSVGTAQSYYVVSVSDSRTIVANSTIGNYSGMSSEPLLKIPSVSINPVGEEVAINLKVSPNRLVLASSGNLTVPNGKYEIACIGGGGGGGYVRYNMYMSGGGGGGGGYVEVGEYDLNGTYKVTVGSGGSGGSSTSDNYSPVAGSNGGTTSFGSILSANGGNGGTYGGGAGGSGGGGSGSTASDGGDASYSGGGGGDGTNGKGGPYGGRGGTRSSTALDGDPLTEDSIFYTEGETYTSSKGTGYGAGGGGYGANGGSSRRVGTGLVYAGGGGGGIALGSGGAAGANSSGGGTGYGAGGGGGGRYTGTARNSAYCGGGGGGYGNRIRASGGNTSSGGKGANGCVLIRYVIA